MRNHHPIMILIFSFMFSRLCFAGDDPPPIVSNEDRNTILSILENKNMDKEYKDFLKKWGENDDGTKLLLIRPIIDGLSSFYKNDKETYWKCISILSRTKNLGYNTQGFHNPIKDMIDINDKDSFDRTVKILPSLLREPDNSWAGYYLTPIGYAVSVNNIEWVKILLNNGVLINDKAYAYGKGYESVYKMNLLSIAQNEAMKSFLISSNILQIAEVSWDSYCRDDNVRLRDNYSIDSNVIGKLMKGDKFKVIGHTYAFYKLPSGDTNRWVNIEVNGMKAWIWGAFVWEYQR